MNNSLPTDTLISCENEPIQAPGSIQPHGALICFASDGRVLARSSTAEIWLGTLPGIGEALTPRYLNASARIAIDAALQDPSHAGDSVEWERSDGMRFDLVMHWSDDNLMVEWEHIADQTVMLAHYAALARSTIRRLQERKYTSVNEVLQAAADTVRVMTECDRVMAYRFLADDSGEVIGESRREDLVSYLYQRFPSGDIPAQARRLYVLSPIRQISSVNAVAVPIEPLLNLETNRPYDLSHSVLRSVSPVHIEYLKNMGVAASMSISIVINERLWGMIACHHMSDHRVPHAIRLSCILFMEVVTILLQQLELEQRVTAEQSVRVLGAEVAFAMRQADDPVAGLVAAASGISAMIGSDAVAIVVDGQTVMLDAPWLVDKAALLGIAEHMREAGSDLIVIESLADTQPHLIRPMTPTGVAAGLLAIQMNGDARITIIWLRNELVQTINWAGAPDKVVAMGPNGARLTPRASFESWKQVVTGRCRAWTETDVFAARELKSILQDVALQRLRDADRSRMILLATLAHDLRDPLQSVDLAVQLMRSGLASVQDAAQRVEGSTRRMQSLITYILDVSRIRAGMGLILERRKTPLTESLNATVNQLRQTYPGITIEYACPELGDAELDEDRFAQALGNLVNNARQHGDMSEPIRITGALNGVLRTIAIRNRLLRKQTVSFARLVDPFKSGALASPNNKGGMGLGLYIANAIVRGHGATLDAVFTDNEACFTVTI
ncbi:GAF domain-containing protein [uncultured Caballeronia sp.]|uniref:GAF domain-containing protein n=1 Tax=uncultured Caballeronia sp. TaxID=1827198 RepID=UPI0035C9F6C6